MRVKLLLLCATISNTTLADPGEDLAARMAMNGLIEACGEEDKQCKQAVKDQYMACHKKYEKEWKAYYNASQSDDEEELEAYMEKVVPCIVDEDGDSIFEY